jgi:hypothetical protein
MEGMNLMESQQCGVEDASSCQRLCLRAVADADPNALVRVLQLFQQLNVVPHRVIAESATTGQLHIEIYVSSVSEERLSLIAAKATQMTTIHKAYWHFA